VLGSCGLKYFLASKSYQNKKENIGGYNMPRGRPEIPFNVYNQMLPKAYLGSFPLIKSIWFTN
jgi:hypothetical protein